jgi:hypothetical protein
MDVPTMPEVPAEILSPGSITPAPRLRDWTREVFIQEGGALQNSDQEHLQHARIGMCWTTVEWHRKDKRIAGEAQLARPQGSNAWSKARERRQLRRMFDEFEALPDFLITVNADWVTGRLDEGTPYAVCALIEHELYHCAQGTDADGFPAFDSQTGRPKWTIDPHDVEEFVGVAERYGAATDDLQRMQGALRRGPTVEEATVEATCGCGAPIS